MEICTRQVIVENGTSQVIVENGTIHCGELYEPSHCGELRDKLSCNSLWTPRGFAEKELEEKELGLQGRSSP